MSDRKRYRRLPCSVCGKPVLVSAKATKLPRCLECGIDAMKKHQNEMHQKHGPSYDKWRNAMKAFADSIPPGGDPPNNVVN